MARAVIIDPYEVLTDESGNERDALAAIRPLVAAAGIRVTEQHLAQAEQGATDSFAPNFVNAVIFRLVNRDSSLALKVASQLNKSFNPIPKLRPEAADIVKACKNLGWRIALTKAPHEEIAKSLQRAGAWQLIDVKGPPPAMKISLPDQRVLEFLLGALKATPAECVMLGTRVDRNIRPAKLMRMTAIHLKQGRYGTKQQPRDLSDVADYEAANAAALIQILPNVQ